MHLVKLKELLLHQTEYHIYLIKIVSAGASRAQPFVAPSKANFHFRYLENELFKVAQSDDFGTSVLF